MAVKVYEVEIELKTPLIGRITKKMIKQYPEFFHVEKQILDKYEHLDRVFKRLPDGDIDPNQFRNMIYTMLTKDLGAKVIQLRDIEVDFVPGMETLLVKETPVLYESARPGSRIRAVFIGELPENAPKEKEVSLGAMRSKGYGIATVRIKKV